ncbi:Rrf2 family transcriptional regulator [Fertoebacter nigrum]|uniref:Rrf2 family transcriptional regulator n=1 Tax=Fertoeibacter niger TaxID=2656921 RepID=A0A8X8GTP9_9RHOB|nr:Rrf2 family transcriptional regulator [Fertoeibacter niger]NUB44184.1 Rrf2 family transcriptional regulator [Fertoeibacter niger]
MKQDSKLSLALHALGHMARAPGQPMTSDVIAQHNATNPVVVRRVLGLLRDKGIVLSEKGHAGGWRLARPPATITLADVYLAIGEPFLRPQPLSDMPSCAVVAAMQGTVLAAMAEAEAVLIRHFTACTIADLGAAMQDGMQQAMRNSL